MGTNPSYENEILDLIVKNKKTSGEEEVESKIIYEYQSPKVIGTKILQDFLSFYDSEKKRFPLVAGNSEQKFGTIPDIMALSTFLELKSLEVDLSECEDIYYATLERVFSDIYQGNRIVFDATPYWNGDSYVIDTYVETASKLISTLVDLRDDLLVKIFKKKTKMPLIHIRGEEISNVSDLLLCVERLLIQAVNMINDAALPLAETYEYKVGGKRVERNNFDPIVRYRGWAFQKPPANTAAGYETSLYYTYYGTNAFISIYNSMEVYYDYLDGGEGLYSNLDKNNLSYAEKQKYFKYLRDEEFYKNNKDSLDRMRYLTTSAGRDIETRMRQNGVNISFDYVDNDLKTVSLDNISRGRNNHIMNSLFCFSILINSGIDDDYVSVGKSNIFQSIQFALTNIKKIYLAYREEQKEDLIDNFNLGEDKCPSDVGMIMQAWRKAGNIVTYELVPLYCNTYNLISNYIIKYPQKEMRENLVWLLGNKSAQGWFWSKEGFSINNNLYYIYAIDSFYAYYRQYEADFLNADGLRNDLVRKEREILRVKENAEKAIQKNKEEYDAALQEALSKRSPLEQEVEKLVSTWMDKAFGDYFEKTFSEYVDAGMDFVLRFLNEGGDSRDDFVEEFRRDKRLQLIFTASSLELAGASARERSIFDLETTKQKEMMYRALFEKIFNKLYR